MKNFESEPNIEKEEPMYMEKLREVIEEGRQYATTPEARQYIEGLEKELETTEQEWETL